ncbi:hypothetical protein BJF83_22405 [Nocardiopsis sp. CNR-923]|uniref:RecT family recombinase n=1 Tax=Nocardiopsis sp. CNR-923 TaxID=1904965 RepID=UPI00095BCEF7|nr:RecT family recombinase [Nocardiopsis sp. CNR-923]OLT25836.1 hypothetical protein BJF83_22405 [Nocardiopsis sp. CNR-923]
MTGTSEETQAPEPEELDVDAQEEQRQEPESEAVDADVDGVGDEAMAGELAQLAGGLVVTHDQVEWSEAQIAALRQMGIEEAPFGEQLVFLHVCQRSGLDPFSRQVYLIGRTDKYAPGGKKWTIQVGIDGFRAVARGTGMYRGQIGPEWCGPDGVWTDVWVHDAVPPVAARVGLLHAEMDVPVWGVAKFVEFRPQGGSGGDRAFLWRQMPSHMIAKCAEASAIRKAFPQVLGGAYIPEEMDQEALDQARERRAQASSIVEARNESLRRRHRDRIDRERTSALFGLLREAGVQTPEAARNGVESVVGRNVTAMGDLTWAEADQVEASLRQRIEGQRQTTSSESAPTPTPDTSDSEAVDAEIVEDPVDLWRSLVTHFEAQERTPQELELLFAQHTGGRSPTTASVEELRQFEEWMLAGDPGQSEESVGEEEPPEDPWA